LVRAIQGKKKIEMTESMIHESSLAAIRQALSRPLPGRMAQIRMSARPRPGLEARPSGHQPRQGGVLILLYPKDGRLHFPLTRRTETLEDHKGQISLPGGAREGDEPLEWTALRETYEELGVDPQTVQVLGALTPLYIFPSDYCITPYVAARPDRPTFVPDPIEVAAVLEVSLVTLLDPTIRQEEEWVLHGTATQVPFYQIGEHKVWGATAMVLSEFVAVLDDP
jgi:8-oxo-dGTP pyrophosphatase MutT (NUDIX family)